MKRYVANGYGRAGFRPKEHVAAVHLADSSEQLDVVEEYLRHVTMTRVRRHMHNGSPVVVHEDHGTKLKVSVGGMIGWCLRAELDEGTS